MASTPLRFLMTCWFYLVVCTFFIISFILQLLLYVLLLPFMLGSKRYRRQQVMSFVFQTCMVLALLLMPFWRVKFIRRPPRCNYPQPLLIMCNHTSGCDPWVLTYALYPWPVLYVVKESLLRVPVAGWALHLAGNIPVRFTQEKGGWGTVPGTVKQLMQRSSEVLDEGMNLTVFPEGTRSTSGRLQPFKDGFFRFALERPGCVILPLAMHGNHKMWPVNSRLVDSGTAYVNFGEPIIPHEGMTVAELKEKTHAAVFDLLRASPDFDEALEQPLTEVAATRGHGF